MAEEDDSAWLFDSLMGFLGSPQWALPVMAFIDDNCAVFDDEDENKLSQTTQHQRVPQSLVSAHAAPLHVARPAPWPFQRRSPAAQQAPDDLGAPATPNKTLDLACCHFPHCRYMTIYTSFKEMVDSLLDMHLQDMGITIERFLEICATAGSTTPAGRMALEQILAVDDFISFKESAAAPFPRAPSQRTRHALTAVESQRSRHDSTAAQGRDWCQGSATGRQQMRWSRMLAFGLPRACLDSLVPAFGLPRACLLSPSCVPSRVGATTPRRLPASACAEDDG